MIDIHSHILPGLDDGAPDMRTALKMARIAVKDGITGAIATPHCCDGVFDCQKEQIIAGCARFNRALQKAKINLEVYPGAEIRLVPEIIELFDKGNVLSLGNTNKAVLLELPDKFISDAVERIVMKFKDRGVEVVLAHPERNLTLQNNEKIIDMLLQAGVSSQLTASSILGKFGRRIKQTALYIADQQNTVFVASDSHNLTSRAPKIKKAIKRIQALRGNSFTEIFDTKTKEILEDTEISMSICR